MSHDLSVHDAAEQLQVDAKTVRKLAGRGKLRGAYKTGMGGKTSPWRIPPKALDHFRAAQPQGYIPR